MNHDLKIQTILILKILLDTFANSTETTLNIKLMVEMPRDESLLTRQTSLVLVEGEKTLSEVREYDAHDHSWGASGEDVVGVVHVLA